MNLRKGFFGLKIWHFKLFRLLAISSVLYMLILYFAEKIRNLFSKHNYQVRSFTNQTQKGILKIIHHYSTKTDSESLVCFLSSHGNQTSLKCSVQKKDDEKSVKISDILQIANTKELYDCPKIFFINACRKLYHSYVFFFSFY